MDLARVAVTSPVGTWGVEGDEFGVTRVYMPNEPFAPTASGFAPVEDAADQLTQYFAGRRRSFAVTLAPVASTDFRRRVWATLAAIPYGEVRAYGQVAAAIGDPRAARAVGNANHANPWPIVVPCHRVVASNGLGGYGGGLDVKRFLLALEGAPIAPVAR